MSRFKNVFFHFVIFWRKIMVSWILTLLESYQIVGPKIISWKRFGYANTISKYDIWNDLSYFWPKKSFLTNKNRFWPIKVPERIQKMIQKGTNKSLKGSLRSQKGHFPKTVQARCLTISVSNSFSDLGCHFDVNTKTGFEKNFRIKKIRF